MLDTYAKPLKPGLWRLSAGGISVDLDDFQMCYYQTLQTSGFDVDGGFHVFMTWNDRLDDVLGMLYATYGSPI